jgi:predicted component of type VI protein secretion system
MKQLKRLIEQRSRLIALKDKLNSKATLNSYEGMIYVKLFVQLVLLEMEIESLTQKKVRC